LAPKEPHTSPTGRAWRPWGWRPRGRRTCPRRLLPL